MEQRLRVAMLCSIYPPFPGGASEAISRLAQGLVSQGHQVTVYTADSFRGLKAPGEELLDGVRVKRVSKLVPDWLVLGRSVLNPWDVLRDLKNNVPDVLHLHGMALLGNDVAALAASHIPLILTAHGPGFARGPHRAWPIHLLWRAYLALMGKRVLKRATRIISLTPDELPYWRKWGVPDNRTSVIPWGIPEDCFRPRDGEQFKRQHGLQGPMILFVGSFHPSKGPQWLISAFPKVLEEFPSVTALLCGPELGYGSHLRSLAQSMGVDERVLLLGYVSREELLNAYAACDIFVLPSDYEAFGLAIAEAMAFGKPVVASRVGAVPFLVEDGRSGFLVRPQHPPDLADRVVRLLQDDDLRRGLGERGQVLAQQYRWTRIARQYEHVYLRAMQSRVAGK